MAALEQAKRMILEQDIYSLECSIISSEQHILNIIPEICLLSWRTMRSVFFLSANILDLMSPLLVPPKHRVVDSWFVCVFTYHFSSSLCSQIWKICSERGEI